MKKIISILLAAVMLGSVTAVLAGCGSSSSEGSSAPKDKGEVNVYSWDDYFSPGTGDLKNVLEEFEKETGIKVNCTTYSTNE